MCVVRPSKIASKPRTAFHAPTFERAGASHATEVHKVHYIHHLRLAADRIPQGDCSEHCSRDTAAQRSADAFDFRLRDDGDEM